MGEHAFTSNNEWTLILEPRDRDTWFGAVAFHDGRPGWVGILLTDEEVHELQIPAGPLNYLLGQGRP